MIHRRRRIVMLFVLFIVASISMASTNAQDDSPGSETPAAKEPAANQPPSEDPSAENGQGKSEPKKTPADAPKKEPTGDDENPSDSTPKSEAKPEAKPESKPETKPEAKPKDGDAKPETPASKPEIDPAEAAKTAAAFDAKMEQWKGVFKDLRKVKADYSNAGEDQAAEFEKKWDDLIAKGEDILDELRVVGKEAFVAAPNQDRELADFLTRLVVNDASRDDYEPAAELSQAMLDAGATEQRLFEPAGIAAFATNNFDKAAEYFELARNAGTLGPNGSSAASEIENYKKYWPEEQKLREAEAKADDLPRVLLKTTKGDIILELFENEAPDTVGNFVSLVEKGFYDGLDFHRVLPGFMAQGGCPEGTGGGGPGYNIYCECYKENYRKHFRGSLSMAKTAQRDTGGSQFFLTFVPTAHLNGQHTVFGRIIEGMEVLARLNRVNPDGDSTLEPDRILEATVLRKRDHEYKPNKVEEKKD